MFKNKDLLYQFLRRDLTLKYKGSFLGFLWSFITPFFMMTVYAFIFGVVFQSRWSATQETTGEYALIMFIGLMVYGVFSESVLRAATIIIGHTNYVKKVVFPLEILPQTLVASAAIQSLISLVVWYIFFIIILGTPPLSGVLYVIVLFGLMIMSLGLAYLFAALGVYFRDLSQLLGIVIPAVMFLSPIFYPRDALPQFAQDILPLVNPIAIPIEQARAVLVHGKLLDTGQMVGYYVASLIILGIGLSVFKLTRRGFSDVL